MPNVRLAEEVEFDPPPDLEDFEDEAPPPVSRIVAFLNHAAVKIGATVGVTLLALGFLVLKGPFGTPPVPSEREIVLAAPPVATPIPSPIATPIVAAPPVAAEAANPPTPAAPADTTTAQTVDPSPTGAITPPKKHKHKPKKPKPTPAPN